MFYLKRKGTKLEIREDNVYIAGPTCGIHLDPGEVCEDCKEKELLSATNTEQLKAEQKSDEPLSSAFYFT